MMHRGVSFSGPYMATHSAAYVMARVCDLCLSFVLYFHRLHLADIRCGSSIYAHYSQPRECIRVHVYLSFVNTNTFSECRYHAAEIEQTQETRTCVMPLYRLQNLLLELTLDLDVVSYYLQTIY